MPPGIPCRACGRPLPWGEGKPSPTLDAHSTPINIELVRELAGGDLYAFWNRVDEVRCSAVQRRELVMAVETPPNVEVAIKVMPEYDDDVIEFWGNQQMVGKIVNLSHL